MKAGGTKDAGDWGDPIVSRSYAGDRDSILAVEGHLVRALLSPRKNRPLEYPPPSGMVELRLLRQRCPAL